MSFFIYILRCADGALYIGHTDDLEFRFAQHQSGECGGFTSGRRPVELVYAAEMPTRDEAIVRERQIKKWSRAKKEALIASDWTRLSRLARGRDRLP
jgi:predicted GIY-YIG superfamily endonuclease